jgi:PAS domain S-box-containing protein
MTSNPAESAARDERLHRLLECSSDGICEVDAAGRCTYSNASGAHLLGYEAAELMGTVLHDAIHPGGRFLAPAECSICQAVINALGLKPGEPARRTHGVLSHKDGRAIPVSYLAVKIVVDGLLRGAVMTFSDDSERRRLAEELRDRTAELAESERRKTEFIATLAHELRNPLAPLRAALQVMRKASDNATSVEQLREVMERQLGQLVHLVDDLLDIARVNSGQMTLQRERVALQEILQWAVEASAPLRTTTQNSLTLDLPAAPLYLEADATRLTQVFTNILNNAAQYSAAGGPISVRVQSAGAQVQIDIADAGVGIAREALNRIFDMFTLVGRDAKNTHAGLGIGLNLARRVVEMHDGQLVAKSEGLGRGSHFLITLPLSDLEDEEAAAAAENERSEQETLSPVRALIVDDNIDAAATLSLLLQLAGHTTCLAHDGPEALKAAAEFKPDVVLLDLGLPGMDGFEIARAIRGMPELGHPVLVAVTGWGGPEDRLRSKQAGFDEHLTKPVEISMIELLLSTLPVRRADGDGGSPPVENGHTLDTPH